MSLPNISIPIQGRSWVLTCPAESWWRATWVECPSANLAWTTRSSSTSRAREELLMMQGRGEWCGFKNKMHNRKCHCPSFKSPKLCLSVLILSCLQRHRVYNFFFVFLSFGCISFFPSLSFLCAVPQWFRGRKVLYWQVSSPSATSTHTHTSSRLISAL